MHLTIEAHAAPTWQIHATGRNQDLVGSIENNLILDTFRSVLQDTGTAPSPLRLTIHNEIPLGMGCGSSAAALLAGVALANHFGRLQLTHHQIVAEAAAREGHPDNVAACWFGGFTVSTLFYATGLQTATFPGDPAWQLLLALPAASLSTKTARALLPKSYSRSDAVFNLQRSSLLVAAFAQGRLDLLATAMQDRLHQPYRMEACPLLKLLLPLANDAEIAGVALSGAGPSVLLILAADTTVLAAETRLATLLGADVELLPVHIANGATLTLL